MKKDESFTFLTIDLPLDLILKCYAICIEERITIDELIVRALKAEIARYDSVLKKEKKPKKVSGKKK